MEKISQEDWVAEFSGYSGFYDNVDMAENIVRNVEIDSELYERAQSLLDENNLFNEMLDELGFEPG